MMTVRIGCFLALTAAASTQAFLSRDSRFASVAEPSSLPTLSNVNPASPAEQARMNRIGRVTAVVQISSNCCSAATALERVKRLQQEYADKGVDILVRGTGMYDTFETIVDEFQPEWPPTGNAPALPFAIANDGAFRAGPGNCLLFGKDGYLIAADFHSSELEVRLIDLFSN